MLRSILQNSTAGFYIFASDSTTPTSGKTGLSITATLSKVGGTANAVAPTVTEIGNGLYWVAPSASHRDTLGEIAWQFSGTGAIIAPRLEKVVAVNDQTARFGAAAAGDAMALTSGERTTFAGVLEAAMLNDADGQALLAGMTAQLQSIFDQAGDVPIATLVNLIVSGVWTNATRTLTAMSNVTIGGYATGQDPATLLSSTVSKVSTIDALLAAMTEVVDAVTRFKVTALSQGPGSDGGLTSEQQSQLDRIESSAAQITGARLDVAGSVTPGGTIQLIVGKDYVVAAGSGLNRTVSDPGATLYNQLTSSTLAAVKRFAARRPAGGPTITGTIGTVTHSNGVTTIPIEITRDAIPDTVPAAIDYRYIVERETSDGKKVPVLMDDLTLERAPI